MQQEPQFETRVTQSHSIVLLLAKLNDLAQVLDMIRFTPVIDIAAVPELIVLVEFKFLTELIESFYDGLWRRMASFGWENAELHATGVKPGQID